MAFLDRGNANLWYEHVDLTPPWLTDVPTLVFCHGVGTNCDTWKAWMPLLSPHYRIVSFDTRGFGRSTLTDTDNLTFDFDTYADDILAVVAAAAPRAGNGFHLVGESLGGTISLFLALRNPESIKTLTLASTGFRGASLDAVNAWRQTIADHGMAHWSEQMMEARFVDGAIDGSAWGWFHRVQAGCNPEWLLGAADMLLDVDLESRLGGLDRPVQLLAGDSSPFINLEHTLALRDALADVRLRVFPGARHGIVFSHATDCAKEVHHFITERG